MSVFMKNVSFQSVNVIGTLRESIPRASQMFEKTMAYYFAANCQPVAPVNVMSYSQIEEGFRLVQSGKHIGKVVFKVNDDDRVMALPKPVMQANFDANVTYVLSGGLGGLGRSLSQWMVDHGARNLVFLSRSGSAKPEARALLDKLATDGVTAIAYACDIGNATQVEEAIESCKKEMPPIRGVIQAAMALAVSFTPIT
jgi:KR domain